jgi:hypothetical protein
MAYDIFPKNEKELRNSISGYAAYTQGELILLYAYLRNKFPRTESTNNLGENIIQNSLMVTK